MTDVPYRLFDVGAACLAVASPIRSFHEHLDIVYPDQQAIDPSRFADVRVSLLPGSALRFFGRQVSLWSEGSRPFEPYPLASALPLFEWGSNWLIAQRLNAYLLLHSGVVARGDRAVLLPAQPGSGKSTLTCALHLAGWRYLSDEFGVVDPATGRLLPLIKPASLKNRSIEIVGRRGESRIGPVFPATHKGDVAHFVPDRESYLQRHRQAQASLVIFPRYQAGSGLQCVPVSRAQTALRLGLNSFNYKALGTVGFDTVVALARRARAYELVYGDLDDAVAQIDTLFAGAP